MTSRQENLDRGSIGKGVSAPAGAGRQDRTPEGGRWIRPSRRAGCEQRVSGVSGWERALVEEARRRVGDLVAEGRRLEDRIHCRWDEATTGIERRREEVTVELRERLESVDRTCEEARRRAEEEGRDAGYQDGVAAGREAGVRAGFAAGCEEGRQAGRAEGIESTREEIARGAAAMARAAEQVEADRATLHRQARDDIVSLSLAVARRIIHREISLDDTVVLRAIRSAVDLIFRRGRLLVQVHPADEPHVAKALEDDPRWAEGFAAVEVSASGDVDLGGCRLVTAAGEVDLTVETQLERIETALREAARRPRVGTGGAETGGGAPEGGAS